MTQCVVYLPTDSLSAVGAQSIEDALEQCLKSSPSENTPDVLIIKFPFVTLRSAAQRQGLHQYTSRLPVKLPDNIWSNNKVSFPWSLGLSDLSLYTIQKGKQLYFLKPVSANATVGISTKNQADQTSLASIGFCVHVDTTPVNLSISESQMQLMASVLVGLLQVASAFRLHPVKPDVTVAETPTPTPTSPTMFRESTGSRESPTTPHDTEESSERGQLAVASDSIKITVWMQSTLARLTISLYTEDITKEQPIYDLKLTLDMEDIMTSIDLQQVYLKVKCKIASASIQHFRRFKRKTNWGTGAYLGLVMRGQEDQTTSSAHSLHRDLDDGAGSFLSMTFTRARCCHVHSRWGTRKQSTLLAHTRSTESSLKVDSTKNSSRFISEIVVKLQPVDFVFSPSTLSSFLRVLQPLLLLPSRPRIHTGPEVTTTFDWAMYINNATLPLLYLDTRSVRLIMPAADLTDIGEIHDVFMFQLEEITLSPQVENPLGRVMVRSDIYHMAEQARILGVPGSEVEDRQYQLDIVGFSVSTGTWRELDRSLSIQGASANLHTMIENPALEWNNLVHGRESITPYVSLLPVVSRMNLCVVAAPAIVYREDILVCGHSLEVNAITDIIVSVSTTQLLLASALFTELISLFEPLLADFRTSGSLPPGLRTHPPSEEHLISVTDYTRGADSGIDCADVSSASTRILKDEALTPGVNMSPRESVDTTRSSNYQANTSETHQTVSFISKHKSVTYKDVLPKEVGPKKTVYNINDEKNRETRLKRLVPVEILLTSGTISLVVYELLAGASHPGSIFRHKFSTLGKSNHTEDKGYEGSSEEGSTDEVLPHRKLVQPLIFFLMAQPHAFLSRQSFSRKVQISCFDLSVRTSTLGNVVHKAIPTNEDFPSILVETKCGEPHPDTGIPPSFLTMKWSRMVNKPAKLEVDIGRPTKVYVSIARWHYLEAVADRLLDCVEDITNLPSWSSSRLDSSDKFLNKDNLSKQDEEGELQEEDAKMEPSHSQILLVRFKDEELVGIEETIESLKEGKNLLNDILDEDDDDDEPSESCDDTPGLNILEEHHLQSVLGRIAALSVSSQQLVIAMETSSGMELAMSVAGLSGSLTCISRTQADRIVNNIAVNSFIVTTKTDNITRLLLNPWSFTVDLCLAWEVWHSEPPQIQLTADSDCIMFDIGPDHLRCLHYIWKDYEPLLSTLSTPLNSSHVRVNPRAEYEQHYRDDLRAGAFQFVEASGSREEMPLPYQVVFWGSPPTMAWRYPQPRVLTRVDVFPVPFKVATTKRHGSEDVQDRVLCTLQYWSECQARYQSYAQFQLSESEPCHLELPTSPRRAVACTWRVRLALQSEEEVEDSLSRVSVSPHALAACMRVDSFFSPAFVPTLQAAINISSLQVSLYNHLSLDKFDKSMPPPLQNFIIDNLIPESQCFLSAALDSCSLFVCSWPSGETVVELSSRVRCDVIDYAYLTQQCIVDPFQMQLNCTLGSILEVSCVAKPISIRLGPAVGHTLAVSTQLWSQALQTFLQESDSNSSPQHQVIVSRYVVCNDTTRSLRFGQMTTDEDILLLSRQCHLYSWRTQKAKQQLRVGVEDGGWVWSKPFTIDSDGIQLCPLGHSRKYDVAIVVSVTSLSMTQKQIVISGQLVITNLLSEPFECKVLPVTDDDNKPRAGQCLVAPGQSTPPSILLNSACKTILRVRFQGLDSVWSGDIPINETPKTGQPWLVKIPLQEKGQFLSIWCRVIYQSINHGQKILAMLCPLYMIRSHLPIPAKIFIDTPGLKVHLQTTIKGKGQQQQLYCPGTVDHSHKLMLQLENGIPPSNPYVPLSYTMIDQRTFFKITSYEDLDIDNILKSLVADQDRTWPFVGEEYKDVEWVDTEQPETFVQVKYKPLGPFCSTLLVDLQPWALMINTLGCTISLIVQEKTLCIVPHNGVIMPPKLEETFHLVLQTADGKCSSPSLQLARPDWGSSFYMPRIAGLIPVTGEIQTVIQNAEVVNFANITSELMEDMRIVHIRPNYILCNHTSIELEVATLSVRDSSERWKVSDDEMDICTYSLPPDPSAVYNAGTPIIQWALIGNGDKDLVQYAAFSMKCGWSCPVRVSNGLPRYGFTIPNQFSDDNETTNEAFVLTSQERAGQVYLCVLPEPYPQVTVYNKCNFKILCAQGTPENDGNAVPENMHIEWWCEIEHHTSAHYCPPGSSKQFPGLVSPGALPPLVFSLDNEDKKVWSLSVSIAEVQEQFVCLPGRGDVKVRVELRCHTTYITVETVSHVEISARDIRSRLLERDLEMVPAQVEALCSQEVYSIDKSENSGRCNVSSSSSKMKNSSAKSVDRSYSCETAVESFSHTTVSSYDSALEVLTFSPYVSRSSSKKSNISESSTISKCVIKDSELEEVLQNDTCTSPLLHAVFFVKGIHITLMEDLPKSGSERTEVVLFSLDNVCVSVHPRVQMDGAEDLDINLVIGDLQIDNQMYQRGGFDFPVVLLGQSPGQQSGMFFSLNAPAKKMMEDIRDTALVSAAATFERNKSTLVAKHFKISVGPLSAYIEDTLVTKLMDDLACFLPTKLVYLPVSGNNSMVLSQAASETLVPVPQAVYWDASQLASPLRLRTLVIEPLSVLLSVHTSITLYLALDHSPLHFATFERHQLVTTPYRLGHTITMHYLSGAIFGMGWVVGSLEILGSPGGFARTLGTGLRDFVNLPYQGILQGPWAFLVGVSHGSASLMKHITAGTLSSVTKLAASVARNLDRLTLDREHLQRTEELRRQRPQGLAQGLLQGLTGLGISLLGAVGGIAHHPLQSVMTDGASTRGLVTGVGLGLVGVITKPLSGAAELVALTGEGLLQGTGWTVLPEARQQPVIEHTFCGVNSRLKYSWKLVAGLAAGKHTLLYVTEATCISSSGTYEAVALVLTTRALFLVNMEEDITQRVLSLAELSGVDHPSDPTLLCFHFHTPGPLLEMDATSHARVVDFVRRSSGLVSVVNNEDQPETDSSVSCSHLESDLPSSIEMPLTFYVNPQSRNYFLSVLALAKRQSQGKGFSIL